MSKPKHEILNEEKKVRRYLSKYPGLQIELEVPSLENFKQNLGDKINYLLSPVQQNSSKKYLIDKTGINSELIQYCNDLFLFAIENSKGKLLKTIQGNNPQFSTFYQNGQYHDFLEVLLYMGIWDDGFTNDIENRHSPLGKLFLPIQKYKGNEPIGIIQAAEQQLSHKYKDNLIKAQKLAKNIYANFLTFFKSENDTELENQLKRHPIVQLCNCGASTLLSGLSTPAFILMDVKESKEFSGFSALPHEVGHVLAHTPKGKGLLKAISDSVRKELRDLVLNTPEKYLFTDIWLTWLEECFADAIGVAVIKESETFSLAQLFSDEPTLEVHKKRKGKNGIDEHPVRHFRILLTIEVAKSLFIVDNEYYKILNDAWNAISKELDMNNDGKLEFPDLSRSNITVKIPKSDFYTALNVIAKCMVNTVYNNKNFLGFFNEYYNNANAMQPDRVENELRINIEESLKGKAKNNIVKRIYKRKKIKNTIIPSVMKALKGYKINSSTTA